MGAMVVQRERRAKLIRAIKEGIGRLDAAGNEITDADETPPAERAPVKRRTAEEINSIADAMIANDLSRGRRK